MTDSFETQDDADARAFKAKAARYTLVAGGVSGLVTAGIVKLFQLGHQDEGSAIARQIDKIETLSENLGTDTIPANMAYDFQTGEMVMIDPAKSAQREMNRFSEVKSSKEMQISGLSDWDSFVYGAEVFAVLAAGAVLVRFSDHICLGLAKLSMNKHHITVMRKRFQPYPENQPAKDVRKQVALENR